MPQPQNNGPAKVATGLISGTANMTIFADGTFAVGTVFTQGKRDRLLAFDHDVDSMRRKSTTGRGGAALLTGGMSLLASNNRGVVYATVHGEETGVRTFTTKNPGNTILTSLRTMKAAADSILAQAAAASAAPTSSASIPAQLQQLADLHTAGALTLEEFNAAKARLLG